MIGLRIGNEDKRLNVEVYFFQPLFYIPLRCIPLLLSKLCWGIFSKTYPSFLTLKEGVFSKITPSLFVDKASCTRQFESELSLHSLASLFPIKKGFFLPLRLSCKESSTFSPSPSSSGSGDVAGSAIAPPEF